MKAQGRSEICHTHSRDPNPANGVLATPALCSTLATKLFLLTSQMEKTAGKGWLGLGPAHCDLLASGCPLIQWALHPGSAPRPLWDLAAKVSACSDLQGGREGRRPTAPQPQATHRAAGGPAALLQELLQGDHLAARGGGAGPRPSMGLGHGPLLNALLGERPIPGRGVLMAAEGSVSWGAGVPRQSGRVPAGDQVFTAEALAPAVEPVGGAWVAGRHREEHTSVSLPPASRGLWAASGSLRTVRTCPRTQGALLPGWDLGC